MGQNDRSNSYIECTTVLSDNYVRSYLSMYMYERTYAQCTCVLVTVGCSNFIT